MRLWCDGFSNNRELAEWQFALVRMSCNTKQAHTRARRIADICELVRNADAVYEP